MFMSGGAHPGNNFRSCDMASVILSRNELVGYGFTHLPSSPGQHSLDVVTWRPSGSLRDTINHFYLGGGHQLRNPDLLVSSSDRYRLTTIATGKVHVQLSVSNKPHIRL